MSGGLAWALQVNVTGSPSFTGVWSALIVTWGAYSTKSLILTDLGSGSVSCIASQVMFLLWYVFFTVNFKVDMAVIRLVFSISSVSEVIPSVICAPSPSFHVNCNKNNLINMRHVSQILELIASRPNHTSYRKVYFNEFVQNLLGWDMGMIIFDLHAGC